MSGDKFSLPLLERIDEHRRAAGPGMQREGRIIMHQHLEDGLATIVADQLAMTTSNTSRTEIPTALVARHVASTFVLVLNWWVESDVPWTAAEADARFRRLVLPTLTDLLHQVG